MFRNLVIIVAVFGLGWGASFGAGVAFGRRTLPAAQAAGGTNVQVQLPGGQAGAGGAAAPGGAAGQAGPGGGPGGARITGGTVERLDGQTLVLSGNNQQTRVALNAQTQILRQAPATTADLTPGIPVTVQSQGQPAADGSLTAATITIGTTPSAPTGGPVIQRPGGQGQQGGQAGR